MFSSSVRRSSVRQFENVDKVILVRKGINGFKCLLNSCHVHISMEAAGTRGAPIASMAGVAGSFSPRANTLEESRPSKKLLEKAGWSSNEESGSAPYIAVADGYPRRGCRAIALKEYRMFNWGRASVPYWPP